MPADHVEEDKDMDINEELERDGQEVRSLRESGYFKADRGRRNSKLLHN
jgi:hypothetical protein